MDSIKTDIPSYLKSIRYDEAISREEFFKAVEGAIKDRALIFYFTYKTLKETHPEIDADKVMASASHQYGLYKSKFLGEIKDAADGMLKQTSKTGMIAFDQQITSLSPDYAEKHIHNCPLINAFKEVGCSDEEIKKLCTELLMPGDYGMLENCQNVKLTFPKNLAEDDVCIMCVQKAEPKVRVQ